MQENYGHVNNGTPKNKEWVAIVGMACRFPQANTLDEYWGILDNGISTCGVPPKDRTSLVEMDSDIKANFLKCPIDQFDAGFFGLSPSECKFTDPQARLLLEVSWEAFENAGINPESIRGSRAAVFYGGWLQEYKEAMNNESLQSPGKDFFRKYLGNGFGCTAAKLSHFYGFTGPNIANESGCSSSMMAVHMAIQSLQSGECPLALAGGSNIILHLGRQRKLWAEDGLSKVFDVKADGYARAEGIAVLIMKRYSDAIQDNDTIHAIIRGSASSQEGLSKSFGSPTVESEGRVMREALVAADVFPRQVDYVEAHATGTWVGDPIEATAIVQAYSTTGEEPRKEPLWISSGKANIGHTESCSGMAGIIKVILAMKHETIPKHVNVTKLNPNVDFSPIPGAVPLKAIPWPRNENGTPRIAGVSSFGITGTDVHMIIQEQPSQQIFIRASQASPSHPQLLTISAKCKAALEEFLQAFVAYLDNTHDFIENIIYTASTCRPHHSFRAAILAKDKMQIIQKIKCGDFFASSFTAPSPLTKFGPQSKNICFTFPGRIGTWNIGALRSLYENTAFFRETVDSCCVIFKEATGQSLYPFSQQLDNTSSLSSLSYYAVHVLCQVSLAKLWTHWGLSPTSVLGHCVGEVSAAVVSGALDLKDAFKIISVVTSHFSHFQTAQSWKMLAVGVNQDAVNELIKSLALDVGSTESDRWIDVTCANSASQTIVVGEQSCIHELELACQVRDVRCSHVPSEFPVHSRAVEKACQEFTKVLLQLRHHPMTIPFISSTTGNIMKNEDFLDGMHWFRVFRHLVNYRDACDAVKTHNLGNIFIEMGLNAALTKVTKENVQESGSICVACFPTNGILESVGQIYTTGLNLNWEKIIIPTEGHHRQRVLLPGYPFQRKSFWFDRSPKCSKNESFNVPTSEMVHPLLGVSMTAPVGVDHLICFQNEWLGDKLLEEREQLEYIQDHVIGTQVVLPGAAFLEMILFAWKHTQKCWDNIDEPYVSISNFEIRAPLIFADKLTPKRLQTVINKDNLTVSVYSSVVKGMTMMPWTLNSTANLIVESDQKIMQENVNLQHIISECQEIATAAVNEFYSTAAQVGLNFGEKFMVLKRVYKSTQTAELLCEVQLNDSNNDTHFMSDNDFICHPILLDAMIQTFALARQLFSKKLFVPVKIGKMTVYPRKGDLTNKWYIHCKAGANVISLVDLHGETVAKMEGLEMVATTVEALVRTLGNNNDKVDDTNSPELYEVTWQPEINNSGSSELETPKGERNVWVSFHYGGCTNVDKIKECIKPHVEWVWRPVKISAFLTGDKLQEFIASSLQDYRGDLEGIVVWLEFDKRANYGEIRLPNTQSILEPLLCISKYLLQGKFKKLPKFNLVTRSTWKATDGDEVSANCGDSAMAWGFMRNVRIELPGVGSKSIDIQEETEISAGVELVVSELMRGDMETEVLFRDGMRYVRRINKIKWSKVEGPLSLPSQGGFEVQLPASNLISDLKYIKSTNPEKAGRLSKNQVQVETRSVSLNFKDVLGVMKPSKDFEGLTSIGLDFSGVVSKVGSGVQKWKEGDAVFGVGWETGCMKSHVKTEKNLLMSMPPWMTFAEAATLPAVFLTAWHCMANVAKLRRGQTMLVHAASGGVGLAAIQISSLLGVTVIGTAGNERKRRFVRRSGVELVFSSRSLQFREDVHLATKGQGVDMVLNCLTGAGFKEASLAVLRDGGHFVEISKLDTWTEAEVQEMRPLVQYSVVDLTKVNSHTIESMMGTLESYLRQGKIKPLRYVEYPAENLCEALAHLQKANHIGKVIINMPQNFGGMRKCLLFNERSSYLITGGVGAIGFAVCKWMISQHGAKYVVLVGRRAELDKDLKSEISSLEHEFSAKVIYKQVDISDYCQCEKLILEIASGHLPPLRGIHHCAGVLADKMIVHQDWSNFDKVLQCKVNGAWNLHQLTKEHPLEHFVCYSSAAATFGNVGQCNYVCANAYLDALMQYRRSINYPGLSINWGQWKVGLAENIQVDWLHPMSLQQGVQLLEEIMKNENKQPQEIVAGSFNLSEMLKLMPFYRNSLLNSVAVVTEILHALTKQSSTANLDVFNHKIDLIVEKLQNEFVNLKDEKQKEDLINDLVVSMVCQTLGINETEITEDVPFSEMGLDSILSIEFANRISLQLGNIVSGGNIENKRQHYFVDLESNGNVAKLQKTISSLLMAELKTKK